VVCVLIPLSESVCTSVCICASCVACVHLCVHLCFVSGLCAASTLTHQEITLVYICRLILNDI